MSNQRRAGKSSRETGKSNRQAIDKAKMRMIYYGLVSRRGSPGMLLWLSR